MKLGAYINKGMQKGKIPFNKTKDDRGQLASNFVAH